MARRKHASNTATLVIRTTEVNGMQENSETPMIDHSNSETMTVCNPSEEQTSEEQTDNENEEQEESASSRTVVHRVRRRLNKHEQYNPDFTLLSGFVPEGLLTKAHAIVASKQRGDKGTLRVLRSLEFHKGMIEEYEKLAAFHGEHNSKLIAKLQDTVGDSQPMVVNGVKEFLEGLPDDLLDAIAVKKGVDVNLTREEMIVALTNVNIPVGASQF